MRESMNRIKVRTFRVLRAVLSTVYLALIILSIPLAFDVGGITCGLAFSFTTFTLYFVLTTIRIVTRKSRYFGWVSLLYYLQHIIIPSLLTLFLSYYRTNQPTTLTAYHPHEIWRYFIVNSTPIFTILEGFCSLLLIQAIGETVNWLTVYKSDSWLIVSLMASGSTITAALYFLYRIYVFPFTIDMISASLLGSLLTLTAGLGLFGIVSGKGSMIESALLFAYIVRCIYETFPILSEDASKTLTSIFTQTTFNLRNEIPKLPPQITNTVLQLLPFLASNLPGSFKAIWEFLIMSIHKLPLPLLLNLAYRIGVFYAATKIIPSLYHDASYPFNTPPRTPSQTRSPRPSSTNIPGLSQSGSNSQTPSNSRHNSTHGTSSEEVIDTTEIQPLSRSQSSFTRNSFGKKREPRSTIVRLIYSYSPCIVIAVYTHLMMLYKGELGTELKIWGWWSPNSDIQVIVHPWQFWNWVNMGTTLLLYTAELLGNDSNSGRTALTSHWKVE